MTRPEWMPESITDDLVDAMETAVFAYDSSRNVATLNPPSGYKGTYEAWRRGVVAVHKHFANWQRQTGENPELPKPVGDLPDDGEPVPSVDLLQITLAAIGKDYSADSIQKILRDYQTTLARR